LNAFRLSQRVLLFVLILLVSFSCKKDLSRIGLDLVSPEELLQLGYSDTVQIQAFSVREDSVKTANLTYAMIGSMNDPVFGRTTANWFSQVRLSVEPSDFGAFPQVDSAFLLLPYASSYGDTLSNMTIRVYRLTEDIIDSVHQYSNNTIQYEQFPIGELTFTPKPHSASFFNGSTQSPYLRIPLNSRFGLPISAADTSDLGSNAKFVKYYKGIAIVAEPQDQQGSGAVLTMAVSNGSSRIDMYYHNQTDTSSYSFSLNTDCLRFNHFEHENYTGASPLMTQQIIEGDTTLGQQFLFVQTMGGVRVKVKFPYLKNWFNSQKVIINDAQLIFTSGSLSSTFNPPASIALYPISDDGTLYPYQLPDADEGTGYFGGTYNSSSHTYTFRLTHYVQQVLTGTQSNNGLFLIIPSSSVTGGRLVLNGTAAPSSGLKLYIKYTVVN
jgi:hypothetical protein